MSATQLEPTTTTTGSSATGTSRIVTILVRTCWAVVWAALTAFVVFEVIQHGAGSWGVTLLLIGVAVAGFIAPDLTFLIGAGSPVEKGSLPIRAVPFYNAVHRFWLPLALTVVVGVVLAPLTTATLTVFVAGLSWMAHIAMDRTAGYGLRNADGSR
jgi:hypothetical protein